MSRLKEILPELIKKGYTINKKGEVFNPKGNEVKTSIHSTGYRKFSVRVEGVSSYPVKVHRFQAFVKYGNKIFKKGMLIRHKDGNCLNNSYENLVIGNQSQNMMDRPIEDRRFRTNKVTQFMNDRNRDPENVKLIYNDIISGMDSVDIINKHELASAGIIEYIKRNHKKLINC